MIRQLQVRFVPSLIRPEDLDDCAVVMTDVLRASTTMINALANGLERIFPVAEVQHARDLAQQLGPGTLLGGERGGKIVDGFNCGNSPTEYIQEKVAGQKLVLCTTNGTYTLDLCRGAKRILIGAIVNRAAVCSAVQQHDKLLIACAGTNRKITGEDILFAGSVAERLLEENPDLQLDDSAKIAHSWWKDTARSGRELWKALAESAGGRNLMRLGYRKDIEFCAQLDRFDIVPELDCESWTIRVNRSATLN